MIDDVTQHVGVGATKAHDGDGGAKGCGVEMTLQSLLEQDTELFYGRLLRWRVDRCTASVGRVFVGHGDLGCAKDGDVSCPASQAA